MFAILAIYNNETWPNSIHYFAKRIKILSFTKKPSKKSQSLLKFCQSGEFSPNLVTLFPRLSLLLVNPRPWVVLHLYFFQLKSSLQLGTPKSCDKKDYGKNELTKSKIWFFLIGKFLLFVVLMQNIWWKILKSDSNPKSPVSDVFKPQSHPSSQNTLRRVLV